MAYDNPNFTQIPNLFLDRDIAHITSLAELKVTLVVMRNTLGWQEKKAVMDIPGLIGQTGLSRQSVVDGIKAAMERGTVKRERVGHGFSYEANIVRVQKVDSLRVKILDGNLDSSEGVSLLEKERNIHTDIPSVQPRSLMLAKRSRPTAPRNTKPKIINVPVPALPDAETQKQLTAEGKKMGFSVEDIGAMWMSFRDKHRLEETVLPENKWGQKFHCYMTNWHANRVTQQTQREKLA